MIGKIGMGRRALGCAVLTIQLGASMALAHQWNSNPQPLLNDRTPILADAGSPLAWNQSAKKLWYIESGELCATWMSGGTFIPHGMELIRPLPEGGLAIDSGWHFVFCLDADGLPQCVRHVGKNWVINPMGSEPLTRLLGVDTGLHRVFGFDANAGGIRQYSFNSKTKQWSSALIATGLGNAGDAGAVDSNSHTLYSTHESVDPSIPRDANASTTGTQAGLFKPWPLVATTWNGSKWTSRVLDETGVPQQPAVRASDHRVFYAQRDELDLVHFFQPVSGKKAELFGGSLGWAGTDTYEDNDSYPIEKPELPSSWYGSYGVTMTSVGGWGYYFWPPYTGVKLQGPITVVPYYQPVWTDSALSPRLASFRAVVNPRQHRLIHHRLLVAGELVREQTGAQLAGYLFRDANGVLVTSNDPYFPVTTRPASSIYGGSVPLSSSQSLAQLGGGPAITPVAPLAFYGPLDLTFDPANPPASFAALNDPNLVFYALPKNIVADPTHTFSVYSQAVPQECSLDSAAPFVPAHLRLPTQAEVHTFGHDYLSTAINQPGARYRDYSKFGTDYAVPSAIAVDSKTGVTFYTQAPPPAANENSTPAVPFVVPKFTGFSPAADPKLTPPAAKVWIVMVY